MTTATPKEVNSENQRTSSTKDLSDRYLKYSIIQANHKVRGQVCAGGFFQLFCDNKVDLIFEKVDEWKTEWITYDITIWLSQFVYCSEVSDNKIDTIAEFIG